MFFSKKYFKQIVTASCFAMSLLSISLSSQSAFAQATSGSEQLKGFLAQAQSAKGTFTQKVVKRNGKVSENSSGDFVFTRPGKFRWTYVKPYQQLLVADGKKLFLYDQELAQVTERTITKALGSSPAAILFGGQDVNEHFSVKELPAKSNLAWVELVPKVKDSSFEWIKIGLKEGMPIELEVKDTLGQTTFLNLLNVEKNATVDPSIYQFIPPKGVTVLQSK